MDVNQAFSAEELLGIILDLQDRMRALELIIEEMKKDA